MPSKQVTERARAAKAVLAAAEQYGAEASQKLQALLGPYLAPGEHLPEIECLLALIGRRIQEQYAKLETADLENERELADDAEPRRVRNAKYESLRAVVSDLRDTLISAYPVSTLGILQLEEPIPEEPASLVRYVRAVLVPLEDLEVKIPEPKRRGVRLIREEFAKELRDHLPVLEKALEDVAREAKEAEATQARKNQAMEGFDATFASGAGTAYAILRLVGLDEAAEKIRPSARKAGQLASSQEPG